MNLRRLRRHWDALGRTDPLWAVLTVPEKRGNRWGVEEFFATGGEEIEEVMGNLRSLGLEPKPGRALDFGCGPGRLTQALADRFDEAWGVDIAPSMIELANRYNRHPGRCRFFVNDSPDLSLFEDGSFDFIYSNITLQHIEPRYQEPYLTELLRVLAPGGLFVFQLPSRERIPQSDGPIAASDTSIPVSDAQTSASRSRLKERLKSRTPGPLLTLYRQGRAVMARLRRGSMKFIRHRPLLDLHQRWQARSAWLRKEWALRREGPRMEMWGTPQEEGVALLLRHGGRVLNMASDEWAPDWIGFRYTVTKD